MTLRDRLNKADLLYFLDKLSDLFTQMDTAYDTVADAYGFHCRGCTDNCCYSRFYHHTLLEYIYLNRGLDTLDDAHKKAILARAEQVVAINREEDRTGVPNKVMCPLNEDGMCQLYMHRPMVCRLHGMAHELCKPGLPPAKSPGCDLFTEQTRGVEYIPFDRTPLYVSLAQLERDFRLKTGMTDRLKHTIAEMLLL
jgi:Fe-S-cluster containining protein